MTETTLAFLLGTEWVGEEDDYPYEMELAYVEFKPQEVQLLLVLKHLIPPNDPGKTIFSNISVQYALQRQYPEGQEGPPEPRWFPGVLVRVKKPIIKHFWFNFKETTEVLDFDSWANQATAKAQVARVLFPPNENNPPNAVSLVMNEYGFGYIAKVKNLRGHLGTSYIAWEDLKRI